MTSRLGDRVRDVRARRAASICGECDRAGFHAASCPLMVPPDPLLNPTTTAAAPPAGVAAPEA